MEILLNQLIVNVHLELIYNNLIYVCPLVDTIHLFTFDGKLQRKLQLMLELVMVFGNNDFIFISNFRKIILNVIQIL